MPETEESAAVGDEPQGTSVWHWHLRAGRTAPRGGEPVLPQQPLRTGWLTGRQRPANRAERAIRVETGTEGSWRVQSERNRSLIPLDRETGLVVIFMGIPEPVRPTVR